MNVPLRICLQSQPDRAANPAQDTRSYTTPRGTISTNEIALHKALSGSCGVAQSCTPMSLRHGTSDSVVRCLSAQCSSQRRQSSPNWSAASASEGCLAPYPAGRVPPPTRDCIFHTSVWKKATRPGRQVSRKHQIGCLLRQLDSALRLCPPHRPYPSRGA